MITPPDLDSRIRETLSAVADTTEISAWAPVTPVVTRTARRHLALRVALAAFVVALVSVGAAAIVAGPPRSRDVAAGPVAAAPSCLNTAPASASFVVGTARDADPRLLYLPTSLPEGVALDAGWSTSGGEGCLHGPALSLVAWAPDGTGRVEAAIQVRYGISSSQAEEQIASDNTGALGGPSPGDHTFEVLDYGADVIYGSVAGEVLVSVLYEGATLEETMELLGRIAVDADGALRLDGATGRFEVVAGETEAVGRVLPVEHWYVADHGGDAGDRLTMDVRFVPGFTPASVLRPGSELVTVGEEKAAYSTSPATGVVVSELEWELAPGVVATVRVQGVDIGKDALIRIAEAVRPVLAGDPSIPPALS
jgi:hypothetical protein